LFFGLSNHVQQAQDFGGRSGNAGPLDLGHDVRRQMRLQERTHVKSFPPAIQNQAAGLPARFLPAIPERHLLAEPTASRENVLIVFRQHDQSLYHSPAACELSLNGLNWGEPQAAKEKGENVLEVDIRTLTTG